MTSAARARLRLAAIYGGCVLLLFWALAPIYWLIVSSISTRLDLYAAPQKVWFPSPPTLQHFQDLLFAGGGGFRGAETTGLGPLLWAGLTNSLISSVSTAAIVTILCTGVGYVFARMRFRGKQISFYFIMFMMPLPIWVAIIALFFLMSEAGLVDTLPGLVLIFVAFSVPLATWLMATFVRDIPIDIEEAGLVDGATRWQILRRLVFPLARPGMIAVFLVVLLTTWNAFLVPLVFTRTADSQTMTVVLTLFIGQYEIAWEAMSAAAVMTMLPPLLLALFFQRYLVRGMTLGAVKG
ncbi:MAG: carbohydrate ABC transporter permease [Candidatus Limnocylindrales bacterium]